MTCQVSGMREEEIVNSNVIIFVVSEITFIMFQMESVHAHFFDFVLYISCILVLLSSVCTAHR